MGNVKTKYIYIGAILISLGIVFVFFIIKSPCGLDPRIGNAIQGAAVFVALLAAVIALSVADPKAKKVDVKIEQCIDKNNISHYYKVDLPESLQTRYKDFPDPIRSHRVQFKITNKSGFTLKKPTLSFRVPLEKRHPHKRIDNEYVLTFNSNLYNSRTELRMLEFADMMVLSNSNLPYWNDKDEITIWIRMLLDDGKREPFIVTVSVNSENAEGITKPMPINLGDLIRQEEKNAEKNLSDTALPSTAPNND